MKKLRTGVTKFFQSFLEYGRNHPGNAFMLGFCLSSFFGVFEGLVGLAVAYGNLRLIFLLIAFAYNVAGIYADIYVWVLIKKSRRIRRLHRVKVVLEKHESQAQTSRPHKILRGLGYFGLFLSTCVNALGFGRFGTLMFVLERKKLPYGAYFLYAGCPIRLAITFYAIQSSKSLWQLIFG